MKKNKDSFAIEFAESVKKQNDELKAKLDKLDTTYVGEFDTRVQSQAAAAKEAYRKAYEEMVILMLCMKLNKLYQELL